MSRFVLLAVVIAFCVIAEFQQADGGMADSIPEMFYPQLRGISQKIKPFKKCMCDTKKLVEASKCDQFEKVFCDTLDNKPFSNDNAEMKKQIEKLASKPIIVEVLSGLIKNHLGDLLGCAM